MRLVAYLDSTQRMMGVVIKVMHKEWTRQVQEHR